MIMTHKVIVDCFHVNRKGHLHRLHTFSLLITERSTQLIQMMSAVVMRAAGCMSVSWSPAPTASTKIQGNNVNNNLSFNYLSNELQVPRRTDSQCTFNAHIYSVDADILKRPVIHSACSMSPRRRSPASVCCRYETKQNQWECIETGFLHLKCKSAQF